MTEINNIHDTFFRETMSHKVVAADFLANYLPTSVLAQIKLDTLTITKDTFVDKKQAAHYSDLLYQVKLIGDRPGFVYFLFEHKSYPDRFISLQLLRYLLEIWELYRKQHKNTKTLPLIIPIVVYHGKPKGQSVRLMELIDLPDPGLAAYIPDFDLAFYDFSPETDAAIKGEIWLRLVLHCLQVKNTPEDLDKLVQIIYLFSKLDNEAPALQWMSVIFRYLLQVVDIEPDVLQDLVTQSLSAGKEEMLMTVAERLEKRGEARGLLEGEAKGRNAILSRLLSKRFGLNTLDIRMQERLRNATPEQLDRWAERILDAKTLEEVFEE
ncbi:MAG: Rpn family recombination-promoting nuclease/putative transposase [Spartobacteria bacterium]|nr:Rpn family recombination-promoting nuclease/putative transposase [Spartobacteria bacterium]